MKISDVFAWLLGSFVLLAAPLAVAQARNNALTVYAGYRGGGSFDASTQPGQSLDLADGGAVSASIDWALDASRQWQLFVSYQDSELPASAATGTPRVPLSVSYVHFGGTNFFEGAVGRGPYVVGGLGITRLAPGLDGLSNEIRPSMNLGLGYQLPLAPAVAMRLEIRGYVTLINSSGTLFCSGGCVVALKGDTLVQGEALFGVSFGF
jgi:hypothetical protein